VKKWNIDHLKDRATPVEVWWTHDPVKRECAWSAAVAGLPGVSVPAPRFGSNDCSRCAAHLYRSGRRPGFRRFAAAVGRAGMGDRVFRAKAEVVLGFPTPADKTVGGDGPTCGPS